MSNELLRELFRFVQIIFKLLSESHKSHHHTLDISVEKKQVTSQQRSQHSQQNYHENLGLRKTLHPPKSTRLKLP